MKKVMGLLLAVMFIMTGLCVMAEAPATKEGSITVAAGVTTSYTEIVMDDVNKSVGFRELDEFIVKNYSGTGTGTVYLSAIDISVTTQVYSAGAHIPGYSTINYPRRTQEAATTAAYLTTNYPVAYITRSISTTNYPVAYVNGGLTVTTGDVVVVQSPTTNYYMVDVPITTEVTNYYMQSALASVSAGETLTSNEKYKVKKLLIKITQPASATANVYKYSIKAD